MVICEAVKLEHRTRIAFSGQRTTRKLGNTIAHLWISHFMFEAFCSHWKPYGSVGIRYKATMEPCADCNHPATTGNVYRK